MESATHIGEYDQDNCPERQRIRDCHSHFEPLACTSCCDALAEAWSHTRACCTETAHTMGGNTNAVIRRTRPVICIFRSDHGLRSGLRRSASVCRNRGVHMRRFHVRHKRSHHGFTSTDEINGAKGHPRGVFGFCPSHDSTQAFGHEEQSNRSFSTANKADPVGEPTLSTHPLVRCRQRSRGVGFWILLVFAMCSQFLVVCVGGHPGVTLLSADRAKTLDSVFMPSRLEGAYTLTGRRTSSLASPSSSSSSSNSGPQARSSLAAPSKSGKRPRMPSVRYAYLQKIFMDGVRCWHTYVYIG
jgi:hypothetical protein